MNLQQVQVSLLDELTKIAGDLTEEARKVLAKKNALVEVKNKTAGFSEHVPEIAGLGMLAVPEVDTLQARLRGGKDWEKKKFLGEGTRAGMNLGGLGVLAGDTIHKAMK